MSLGATTVALPSMIVAVLTGGIEALGLVGGHLDIGGALRDAIGSLNDDLNRRGFVVGGAALAAGAATGGKIGRGTTGLHGMDRGRARTHMGVRRTPRPETDPWPSAACSC